jgi:hypothetical protein
VGRCAALPGTTRPALTKDLHDAIVAHVGVLTALNNAIKDLDRSTAAHLANHPDGEIFPPFNAAQILPNWRCQHRLRRTRSHRRSQRPGTGHHHFRHRSVGFQYAFSNRLRLA